MDVLRLNLVYEQEKVGIKKKRKNEMLLHQLISGRRRVVEPGVKAISKMTLYIHVLYICIDPGVDDCPISSLDSPLPTAHNEMKLKQVLRVGFLFLQLWIAKFHSDQSKLVSYFAKWTVSHYMTLCKFMNSVLIGGTEYMYMSYEIPFNLLDFHCMLICMVPVFTFE